MPLTREFHIIRAHHLHYASLLDDLQEHVIFIRDTHNPAMESFPEEVCKYSESIMHRECENLLTECKRLKGELHMQERRVKNVMGLVSLLLESSETLYLYLSSYRCSAA
jgi:hypothetical protein